MNRFLTAPRIHDGTRFVSAGSVLEVSEEGTIIAIHATQPHAHVEQHEGVLCPGFVNAHCHLELSHLQGAVPRGTGLPAFLEAVVSHRGGGASAEEKETARTAAYDALIAEGVVAVGDIANTTDTLGLRGRGGLHIHTFVEALGYDEARAEARLRAAEEVWAAFTVADRSVAAVLRQSITPHAPYSVSDALFRMIDRHNTSARLSIHTAESAAEAALIADGSGSLAEMLRRMGTTTGTIPPKAASVAAFLTARLSSAHPLLAVHNTYATAADVRTMRSHFPQAYWSLCPGANLYIEDRLPDVPMLMAEGAALCVGTDSLASNDRLSILAELNIVHGAYPQIGWEALLHWGTLGGAAALGLEAWVGSFAKGKKPGVLCLRGLEEGAPVVVRRLL